MWHRTAHRFASPTNCLYYGKEDVWNYDTGGERNAGSIQSPAISLADVLAPITLSFNHLLQTEDEPAWDQATVLISADDGATWAALISTTNVVNPLVKSASFTDVTVDISAYAGSGILLRFNFDTMDGGFNNFEGWYLDDVVIRAAAVQQLQAVDKGWYDDTGYHKPMNANYFCGQESAYEAPVFRNWFVFDVPVLTGTVASAELLINSYNNSSPSGFETYALRHVATPVAQLVAGGSGLTSVFDDLADGMLYGSRDVYASESGQAIRVPLNAVFRNALAAASGGQIALGGALSTLDAEMNDEYLFAFSPGYPIDVQLRFTLAPNNAPRVALFCGEADAGWNADVKAKLVATGLFGDADVDVYAGGFATPTLSQLQQYAAVLTWSSEPYADGTALGDVLADYVDNGGGVVVATFAFYGMHDLAMGGRFASGGYLPFTTGSQDQPGGLTLVKDLPLHPLLSGVTAFDGGLASYHNAPITIAPDATLVAHWSNGQPLLGARETTAGRIAGLNFYPPSSDARQDFWAAGTDGGRLLANALLWAAKRSTRQTVVAVFDNPLYVDSASDIGGFSESDNVQASLTALGYPVFAFTDILSGLDGQSVVLIPELENGDLAADLTEPERAALQRFVQGGGTLVVHGSCGYTRAADLINAVLGTSLTEVFEDPAAVYSRTPQAAGTSFSGCAATLAALDGSDYLTTASLPPGALSLYSNDTRTLVAVLPSGAGRIVFLGWDWWNAMPIGYQDGGWLQALSSAVVFGGLPPSILTQPTSQAVAAGGSATFSVTAAGTEPLSYLWRRNGTPVAGATASSYTIDNAQLADTGGQFSCLVSNAYGTAVSDVATLAVDGGMPLSVLLIWDVSDGGTLALSNALANAGIAVTLSDTDETGYDGTNPSPEGFLAVIHLNGTTYTMDMPTAGQSALCDYVRGGGGYIQNEWDVYEFGQGNLANMRDLILLDRSGGDQGGVTYARVPEQAGHPVLAHIPSNITFQAGYGRGPAHAFATNPVTVLMTHAATDEGAVAVRQLGLGRIVAFSHAGNYAGFDTLSDANVQQLYINAVLWAGGGTTIIDTTDAWGDEYYISPFGEPDTATYGQTFVAPPHAILNRFTVYLNDLFASTDFKFYIMAWDGAKATGPILYQSAAARTAGQSGKQPFTFYTGDLFLTPGATYVAFACASTLFDGVDNGASMGLVTDAYAGGSFVYLNNGSDFSALTNSTWALFYGADLAFVAAFAGSAGGGGGVAPLRFQPLQLSGDSLRLSLGTADRSPITPERAARIQLYATTNLVLPFSSWPELTQPKVLADGVLWVDGLCTTNPVQRFFRAVETP